MEKTERVLAGNIRYLHFGTDRVNVNTGEVNVTLDVYQHNAAFDRSPNDYATSGTLLETLTTTHTLAANVDHALTFFAQKTTVDSSSQGRDKLEIDNVYIGA